MPTFFRTVSGKVCTASTASFTCADFQHIWLNEGFATWSEAYWKEQSESFSTYQAYMAGAAFMGAGPLPGRQRQ